MFYLAVNKKSFILSIATGQNQGNRFFNSAHLFHIYTFFFQFIKYQENLGVSKLLWYNPYKTPALDLWNEKKNLRCNMNDQEKIRKTNRKSKNNT